MAYLGLELESLRSVFQLLLERGVHRGGRCDSLLSRSQPRSGGTAPWTGRGTDPIREPYIRECKGVPYLISFDLTSTGNQTAVCWPWDEVEFGYPQTRRKTSWVDACVSNNMCRGCLGACGKYRPAGARRVHDRDSRGTQPPAAIPSDIHTNTTTTLLLEQDREHHNGSSRPHGHPVGRQSINTPPFNIKYPRKQYPNTVRRFVRWAGLP